MEIKSEIINTRAVLTIVGSITSGMEFDLSDAIQNLINNSKNSVHIDIAKVPYLNAAAIGIFLIMHKEMERQNRELVILDPSTEVKQLIKITRVEDTLNIRIKNNRWPA